MREPLWIAVSRREVATALRRVVRSFRRGPLRLRQVLQDRRLTAEERRGVLGPAHLRWAGNSSADNRTRWAGWDWSHGGEEWSASPEWKQALIDDVIMRWIPAGTAVLEIGPGAGRWSDVLAALATRLILVDVSERPLELCRARFGESGKVEYVLSSGTDLPGIANASIDAVWSFDVFVYVAPRDQAAYLDEITRVLAPGGVALVHHADGRNRGHLPSRRGWRSPMSRDLFASIAAQRGLRVERQFNSWGPGGIYDLSAYADVITVCRRD